MFKKTVRYCLVLLIVAVIFLQGCTPSFGISKHSVWPPEEYDAQDPYPGTLVFSRSAELGYLAGLWERRADWDQPVHFDSEWEGYPVERSPDGSRLAYVVGFGSQCRVKILDAEKGEVVQQFALSITSSNMTWAGNNMLFFVIFRATGADYYTARGMITPGDYGYATLDLDTGQENIYFPDWALHESQFGGPRLAFSPLGDTAVVLNNTFDEIFGGYFLIAWDLKSEQRKWAFPIVTSFAWSPDGNSIAVIDSPDESMPYDDEILLIDPATGQAKRLTYYLNTLKTDRLSAISWSPDGRYILHWLQADTGPTAEPDPGTLYLVDTQTRQAVNLGIPYGVVNNLIWSPDSRYFAFNNENGIVMVDIQTYKSFYAFESKLPFLLNWIIP